VPSRVMGLYPDGNTVLATAVGVALTNVGTPTLRTVATTNALTRMRRVAYVSATADRSDFLRQPSH
jgi:hypothetical protein